jgi:dienelactone hydrolase
VVAEAGELPIVLTRVGRERPELAALVDAFIEAAQACGARLEIVDVPNGQHAFDILDHTDESRAAVMTAFEKVLALLS